MITKSKTESDTISRCLEGDRESFGILVRQFQQNALFVALKLLREESEAKAAVQQSFVRAYENLALFDRSRPFYPWFRTILKNECLKRLKRSKRHAPEMETSTTGGENVATSRIAVQEALQCLGNKDREILTLKHYEGLTYQEIGERLGIPLGTVMSRLHAARIHLRRQLEGDQ